MTKNVIHAHDERLVSRVTTAYSTSIRTPVGSNDSVWLKDIQSANMDTHDALESGNIESITNILRNPATSMLFYGFDGISKADANKYEEIAWWPKWLQQLTYDSLLQITKAVGIQRLDYPEAGIESNEAPDPDALLQELDSALGYEIDVPNIFEGEAGLNTSRGIISYRTAQAIYQAYRIKQVLGGKADSRVVEIGAGLGRTAYYAVQMGIQSYTCVDLPLTGVAQGYYLGRVLGENNISLWGENTDCKVKIIPPVGFFETEDSYDLVVNVDSMTEMAQQTARNYIRAAKIKSPKMLSINHEYNSFTVSQLLRECEYINLSRSPYWLRRGYVDELVEFA